MLIICNTIELTNKIIVLNINIFNVFKIIVLSKMLFNNILKIKKYTKYLIKEMNLNKISDSIKEKITPY